MMTLQQQMEAIEQGSMVQFAPLVRVTQAQLISGQEIVVPLAQLAGVISLPPAYIVANQVLPNPPDVILGVRINRPDAPMLPWGLAGNNVASFTGPVNRIFVTLLSNPRAVPGDVVFLAGRGIGLSYSGGMTAAGTPASQPGAVSA